MKMKNKQEEYYTQLATMLLYLNTILSFPIQTNSTNVPVTKTESNKIEEEIWSKHKNWSIFYKNSLK